MGVNPLVDVDIFSAVFRTSMKMAFFTKKLSGQIAISVDHPPVLLLDPDGSARDVLLPVEADSKGLLFYVFNTAGGQPEVISVKEDSDTTVILSLDQNEVGFVHCDGTTWRGFSGFSSDITSILATEGGVGIVGIAETYKTSVARVGGVIKTEIMIDITGLNSKDTNNDIIGDDGTGKAHLGRIVAARNGTIWKGRMNCLETPVGGTTDIALWSATEDTGVEDTLITDLADTELVQSQGDSTPWVAGDEIRIPVLPAADQYLYLVVDGAGTDAVYTAGRFLIEFWGV